MTKHSDLTFITNEEGQSLLERFKALIPDTDFFDVLAGYFYTSGFYALYKPLERAKKIRVLIGISANKETADLIQQSQKEKQYELCFSHAETKELFSHKLANEMENSQDSQEVEEGILKFKEWLLSGKLEIKAYPSENLHAKLYIMSFAEGDRDRGRVITGSSNFTKAGLTDNLEFNVELKNRADYEFALQKFNQLWSDSVDLKDKYIETIQTKTWLSAAITPYQLYLKFLYEYFKDELDAPGKMRLKYTPQSFKHYEYQDQAVRSAKRILDEYGGVFLSDVVGLGKTYMSAMLASQLPGRTLVIASPILLDESNPGSWPNVFKDFNLPFSSNSRGKLERLLKRGTDEYENIFIDEAHHFRTETNITYENLARICRGKRVVLVTATPLNNKPEDILSQIKLFQNERKSSIPNVPDLKSFFGELGKKIKQLDKKEDYARYMEQTKSNAKKIRESILKHLMVRRTRTEIESYFTEDLKNQNLKFPEVEDPKALYYQFNKKENEIFQKTVELIGKKLKYARYTALIYYQEQEKLEAIDIQSQKNLGLFMKILLTKRLESSFCAFRKSLERFISSYELFIEEFKRGNVYISKDYANKIFDLLNNDDDEAIKKLIEEGKAKKYQAKDFAKSFKKDLEGDLEVLKEIKSLWDKIKQDPKLDAFIEALSEPPAFKTAREHSDFSVLRDKKSKLIVFTESKETAEYLGRHLNQKKEKALVFTGSSSHRDRETIIENFDANALYPKDDYRILIATELLAEGVNLHRSHVVINYDIPWNPTRLMQRVGRINRVDTKFDKIWIFNFFPTAQSNDIIKLKETAEAKIHAFISLLGADARLLTEGEVIESHKLFSRLMSKKSIVGEEEEEESELKYLKIIKGIRDKDPDLFNKIKRLPKKARTARVLDQPSGGSKPLGARGEGFVLEADEEQIHILQSSDKLGSPTGGRLLTYFRKGKIQKFFIAGESGANELDFVSSAKLMEIDESARQAKLPSDFYTKLDLNKKEFIFSTDKERPEPQSSRSGQDSKLLKILKAIRDLRQYTEEQEDYFKKVIERIEEGAMPKQTVKTLLDLWNKSDKEDRQKPLIILALLQKTIAPELLKTHISEKSESANSPREVILSEYLIEK